MTGPWLVSYIALWILFLIIVVVLISVLRNLGVLYQSIEQLTAPLPSASSLVIGEALPKITLHDATGEPFEWQVLENKTSVLAVISPDCGPCQALLRQLAQGRLQPDPTNPINVERLVVISLGDIASTTRLVSEIGLNGKVLLLIDVNKEVGKSWGITSTPATLVVDKRLRIVNQIFGVKSEQVEMLQTSSNSLGGSKWSKDSASSTVQLELLARPVGSIDSSSNGGIYGDKK